MTILVMVQIIPYHNIHQPTRMDVIIDTTVSPYVATAGAIPDND